MTLEWEETPLAHYVYKDGSEKPSAMVTKNPFGNDFLVFIIHWRGRKFTKDRSEDFQTIEEAKAFAEEEISNEAGNDS